MGGGCGDGGGSSVVGGLGSVRNLAVHGTEMRNAQDHSRKARMNVPPRRDV